MDALKTKAAAHFGSEAAAISVLPVSMGEGGIMGYVWLPLFTLAMFLFVQWWAAWYPGAEPGGGGYVAQRIFSAKSERDGVLATLSFQVAHYALRPWPWIITGLATVILYPQGIGPTGDKEGAYVQAFVDLLPTPWRGFMMAGFAAAYMSTVATQLNWGASYLVNDVYRRFIRKEASEKHFVGVSRAATVVLFLLSIIVTMNLTSVEQAWKFLIGLGAGTGLVYILRWYWWRINAWSEVVRDDRLVRHLHVGWWNARPGAVQVGDREFPGRVDPGLHQGRGGKQGRGRAPGDGAHHHGGLDHRHLRDEA